VRYKTLPAHLGLAALLFLPAMASAATPEEAARADSLFKEGLRLFDGGQTAKACAKFDESYKVDPALGTLQNLALCHEKEGRVVVAYAELSELLTRAQAAGKPQRADVAREHLAALDTKVTRLVLSVPAGAEITAVEIDGTARDWRAPIPVDPGHHVITAHSSGRPDARVEYDASAGGAQNVALAFAPSIVAPTPPPSAPPPPAPPPESGPSKPLVFTLAGAGAVGIVVGSIFGILTFTQKSSGDSQCSGQYCTAAGLSSENDAHTSSTVSTIAFGIGLAALAVDAVVLLTSGKSVAPKAALTPSGMTVRF
jgi:hypothetical protein